MSSIHYQKQTNPQHKQHRTIYLNSSLKKNKKNPNIAVKRTTNISDFLLLV